MLIINVYFFIGDCMRFSSTILCIFVIFLTVSCASKRNITEIDDGNYVWKKGSFQIKFNNKWTVIRQNNSEITFFCDYGVFVHVLYSKNTVRYDDVINKLWKSNEDSGEKKITNIEEIVISGKKSLLIHGYTVIYEKKYKTQGYFYSGQEGSFFITAANSGASPRSIVETQIFLDGFSIQ